MDAYKILGIVNTASREEIDAAYREQAKRYHPDIGGDAWAFKQVQEAFEILTARAASEEAHAAAGRASGAANAATRAGFGTAASGAEYDAAEARKARATEWIAHAKARAEQRAAANAAAERMAKQASSKAAILAAFVLVAVVILVFTQTQNGLGDSRFVILIGSTLLASAVAQRLDRPAMVVVGTFLLVGALMVAATWCIGLSQALEYEKLVRTLEFYPPSSDKEPLERRIQEMDPSRKTNEFFRIGK